MRTLWSAGLLLLLTAIPTFAESTPPTDAPTAPTTNAAAPTETPIPGLETPIQRVSYIMGLRIGRDFHEQYLELDPQAVARGIADASSDNPPVISEIQARQAMMAIQKQVMAAVETIKQKNKAEGDAFLAKNKTAPDVKTTDSGLQYKIIKSATDPKAASPKAIELVRVHYSGKLIDGTEFDSSYKSGQPITFPVNGVIKGWTQALQMMHVGDHWQLFIPADLAYGENGQGRTIPPNSVLIFDVELLGIQAAPPSDTNSPIDDLPATP